MTEKRFIPIFDGTDKRVVGAKDNGKIISFMDIFDLLNDLSEENEELKDNNKMLSMKMSEVSTKYRLLKEFSDDTNPNEAVKTVLHELMMITKEYR